MSLVQPREPRSPLGRTASARPRRVLVVDDDVLQLRALERVLRDNKDLELLVADNAIDAMLQIGAVKPDLVVIDVFMPGLDGIEACRRIKANPETREIQVVLASAALTDEIEAAALGAGAHRAVPKPVDVAALLDATCTESPLVEREAVPTVRAADLLVEMLADAGVEVVFGLPGGAISPVHDALLDTPIRMITTRHENGAMFAAAGYAQTTGKLAVVAVTSGPGMLNAMTGLASAWCDGLPVLLLVGEVNRAQQGKGVLQDGSSQGLQLVEMARHVTKLAAEVPRPSALPHLLRRAITTALSGRRGPVVLTLPLDVTTAQLSPPQLSGTVSVGATITAKAIDDVANLVLRAERPLMLVGNGVRGGSAPARLRGVVERLDCPVATTPKGKGVFPEDHRLSLGVLGLGGHTSVRRYLASGVDVVLAIGTSLSELATDGFSPYLQPSRGLVHVDIDARQVGKSYSPSYAIVAPADEFLGALAERLESRLGIDPESRRASRLLGIERQTLPASETAGRIAGHQAIAEIQSVLSPDTIFTIDSGEHFVFATHYLQTTVPDAFMAMTGLGSMGQSIGAAIGTQLAFPGRTVAAICGDGCFAMNAFEIATAVAERLPIRVFVFNDGCLGMVEHGHRNVYGRSPDFRTTPLDVCAIAQGLGATTLRVDAVGKLRAAAAALHAARGPVVVAVHIDPEIVVSKRDRVAGLVQPARRRTQPMRLIN